MTTTLKVLPTADAHVGIVHPLDGPLAAEGSVWTRDAFTERRLQERAVRCFEAGIDDAAAPVAPADASPAEPKVAKAKPQAVA